MRSLNWIIITITLMECYIRTLTLRKRRMSMELMRMYPVRGAAEPASIRSHLRVTMIMSKVIIIQGAEYQTTTTKLQQGKRNLQMV
jgi:hypothetical protein